MFKRICIPLLIIAVLLTGCGGAATQSPPSTSSSEMDRGYAPEEPAAEAPPFADEGKAEDGFASSGAGGNAAATERLVIKNASLTIVVENPIDSMSKIVAMAEGMDGFVVTSNTYKSALPDGGEAPEANITVRVPSERLNEALDQIKALVKDPAVDVLNENVSGQDVTKEYTDLQSRLRNLEDAEAQLREIMGSATKPEDVLNVFNQLTYVREQIEVIKGQIQYYEEAAAMSAISVQIKAEVAVQPLTIGTWKPEGVAKDAVRALIGAMRFLAGAAIWLIIFVVPIFLVIYLPLRLLWVLLRRWRANQKAKKAAAAPTSNGD